MSEARPGTTVDGLTMFVQQVGDKTSLLQQHSVIENACESNPMMHQQPVYHIAPDVQMLFKDGEDKKCDRDIDRVKLRLGARASRPHFINFLCGRDARAPRQPER
jgi:hypothetical protein